MNGARLWLGLSLRLRRCSVAQAMAALLIVAAAGIGFIFLPYLREQKLADLQALAAVKKKLLLPIAAKIQADAADTNRLTDFYVVLGEKQVVEQQLKTLFDIAQKNGMRLGSANYRFAADPHSRLTTWQIALPVKATYPQVRQFIEQLLLAIPFASLDELRFKRDAISSPMLEVQLRFSLYLLAGPVRAAAIERVQ